MNLYSCRYNRPYSGGLMIIVAKNKENANKLAQNESKYWDTPSLLMSNINCDFEYVLDFDYYVE